MSASPFDQILNNVRQAYEQVTGLRVPKVDPDNPSFPLPEGVDPVLLVQSELNNLNLLLQNSGYARWISQTPSWSPPAEVYETPDELVINLELAGLTENDVTVEVQNNTLLVQGTRRFTRPQEDSRYFAIERNYGAFARAFSVPESTRAEDVRVSARDGIVRVAISKLTGGGQQESLASASQSEESRNKSAGQKSGQEKGQKK
jgi:HSP20 family protein